jgi:hypothetical protein
MSVVSMMSMMDLGGNDVFDGLITGKKTLITYVSVTFLMSVKSVVAMMTLLKVLYGRALMT